MFRTTLDKLTAIRDEKKAQDDGFTLIELLVVVVIIGILIAIAIPLYLNYEKGANDKAAESDLRAAISDINNCYSANNNTYPVSAARIAGPQEQYTMTAAVAGTNGGTGTAATTCSTVSNLSSGTHMNYAQDGSGFAISALNTSGSSTLYYYDSNSGSGVSSTAPTNFPAGAVATSTS